MEDKDKPCYEVCNGCDNYANNFEEALAGLINQLWQDLTDAEKAQIKEILE